mmetsp:Transcript_26353/g.54003  ORF Transcript_26353/g.54003 Transcript_26353/m.54003 type:complete len:91 (-) Transcript_26353:471-743(-)
MGNGNSTGGGSGDGAVGTAEKIVCVDCDRKTQKELPDVSSSSAGMPCEDVYAAVAECTKEHAGQVAPCREQWDAFKACHENDGKRGGEGK